MIPFLYFLFFFVLLAVVAYALTVRAMGGPKAGAGPARVAASLRTRNRGILLFFLVLIVILPFLEAAIPAAQRCTSASATLAPVPPPAIRNRLSDMESGRGGRRRRAARESG